MTLSEALNTLNMKRIDLARELGVSPETVSRWGEFPPKYVRAYLDARLELHARRADEHDQDVDPDVP